jgi:hypothetical protein
MFSRWPLNTLLLLLYRCIAARVTGQEAGLAVTHSGLHNSYCYGWLPFIVIVIVIVIYTILFD